MAKDLGQKVCIDNQIFIWGLKEHSTPGQESMISDAKALLAELEKRKCRLIVPSVVIGEMLMPVPPDLHAMTTNLMSKAYEIPSFDIAAAALFAKIWYNKTEQKVIEEIKQGGDSRSKIKVDCQIVATAVVNSCSSIISHDKGLRRLAEGYITVLSIGDIGIEGELFTK